MGDDTGKVDDSGEVFVEITPKPKEEKAGPCLYVKRVCGGAREGGKWFAHGPYIVKRKENKPDGEIVRYRDIDGIYKDGEPPD